jgi:DNA-binding PadR family transcriptional regulator
VGCWRHFYQFLISVRDSVVAVPASGRSRRGASPRVDFIELHILHHASEGPLYGLWMIEELARHGYAVNASHLYPRFHRLARQGYVSRRDVVVDGKLRKYYRATRQGRAYLARQKNRLVELVSEALSPEELAVAQRRRRRRDTRGREPRRRGRVARSRP